MSMLSASVAMEKVILQFLSVFPFLQSVLNPQKWGPVCEVALQKVFTVVSTDDVLLKAAEKTLAVADIKIALEWGKSTVQYKILPKVLAMKGKHFPLVKNKQKPNTLSACIIVKQIKTL